MRKMRLLVAVFTLAMMAACTDVGPTGPQGPQGAENGFLDSGD